MLTHVLVTVSCHLFFPLLLYLSLPVWGQISQRSCLFFTFSCFSPFSLTSAHKQMGSNPSSHWRALTNDTVGCLVAMITRHFSILILLDLLAAVGIDVHLALHETWLSLSFCESTVSCFFPFTFLATPIPLFFFKFICETLNTGVLQDSFLVCLLFFLLGDFIQNHSQIYHVRNIVVFFNILCLLIYPPKISQISLFISISMFTPFSPLLFFFCLNYCNGFLMITWILFLYLPLWRGCDILRIKDNWCYSFLRLMYLEMVQWS